MAETNTGMPKDEMKKLINLAKLGPISCAFSQGSDPGSALMLFDKVKGPEQVKKLLKDVDGFKKGTERCGTASVDRDENAKELILSIDKASSGMAKKIVKTLKGTGIVKVLIMVGDVLCESHSDEAPPLPGAAPGADGAAAAPAASEAADATPAAPAEAAEPLDAATITAALRTQIGRLATVEATARAPFAAIAGAAQTALKAADLPTASAKVTELTTALDAAGTGAAPAASAAATAAPAAAESSYAKSKKAWIATGERIEVSIEKLRSSLAETYKGEKFAADIDSRFNDRVKPVLKMFDATLASKLDEMVTATDAALHTKLAAEAQAIMKSYADFVAGEPLIGDLDNNPFAPLAIRQTLTATLAALSQAVR